MTNTVLTIANTVMNDSTVEFVLVSDQIWEQIERDAQDPMLQRSGQVSSVQGLNQVAICGIPIGRTRSPYFNQIPFIEVVRRVGYELKGFRIL